MKSLVANAGSTATPSSPLVGVAEHAREVEGRRGRQYAVLDDPHLTGWVVTNMRPSG